GFIKGFLIVYLVLCALVYAEQPLGSAIPALGRQMESSYTIAAARHVNIITQLRYPELDDLRDAMVAAGDGEDADRNEALARLMENEDFQSLVADEDMRQAAADKDYSYMLSDERVLRLLADEDFRTVLTETDWDELIDDGRVRPITLAPVVAAADVVAVLAPAGHGAYRSRWCGG